MIFVLISYARIAVRLSIQVFHTVLLPHIDLCTSYITSGSGYRRNNNDDVSKI